MMKLTRTGWFFLVVCVLLYLASVTSQSGLLLLLIGLLLGLYPVNALTSWRGIRHLELIPPPLVTTTEGHPLKEPWSLVNQGSHPAGLLTLKQDGQDWFHCALLSAGESTHPIPVGLFERRGIFDLNECLVESTAPFGLVRSRRKMKVQGQVVVVPDLYPAPAPLAAGHDAMVGGKMSGSGKSSGGTQFAGLRPHVPGDPLKQIHWKASSKGLGLMTKTFDEELSGRVCMILLLHPAPGKDHEIVDDTVRAAGSLVFAALDAGHHVEWITAHQPGKTLYPPFTDGGEILNLLAAVQPPDAPLEANAIREACERAGSRSSLIFVTQQLTTELEIILRELTHQHRKVALYLPESNDGPSKDNWPGGRFGSRHLTLS